ncbi:MAG: hypothetical protein AB1730_24170 [Myxococcota bacterium]
MGGGLGGGGGSAIGGGGGGGGGGTLARTPIMGKRSSAGIADLWDEVLTNLLAPEPSPPACTRVDVSLPGSLA